MFFDDKKKVSLGGKRKENSGKDQKEFLAAKRRNFTSHPNSYIHSNHQPLPHVFL
jgi:hypothetical protein